VPPASLNLARRPFVDSRPANVAAVLLAITVLVLTFVSWRTIDRYLEGSRKSREAIASLRTEIERLERTRSDADAALARFDLVALSDAAAKANVIARRRAFSWTRFLSRLEGVLPDDVRVVSFSVQKTVEEKSASEKQLAEGLIPVVLELVSRDPDGLPRLIDAFYGSPYFDRPTPQAERGGEKGRGEGRELVIAVGYRDAGVKR
jgi:hypothetical protein